MRKNMLIVIVFIVSFSFTKSCLAGGFFGDPPAEKPSIFTYGLAGFGIGGLLGASAGYLVVRNGEFDGEAFTIAASIGCISGTAGGLFAGTLDLFSERPGIGAIILRDTFYGIGLFGLVGTVSGGISVATGGDWEHMLLGLSIGMLSGAAIGAIFGAIEGRVIMSRYRRSRPNVQFGLIPARRGGAGGLTLLPSLMLKI